MRFNLCSPLQLHVNIFDMCWEDPLEKGMATHSSILAWKTPWAEEPGRVQSPESQRVKHD